MAAYLASFFNQQLFVNGLPASGYKLYSYISGSTTPKTVYTDQTGTVSHLNPITLDADGYPPGGSIWVDSGKCTFALYTDIIGVGALVRTWNGVPGAGGNDAIIALPASMLADFANTTDPTKNAGSVGYSQSLAYANATVGKKLREVKSFEDFMPAGVPVASRTTADVYSGISAAWTSAITNGHDLFHPGGVYDIGAQNYPWRQAVLGGSLLDCLNTTISGKGPSSIFKTSSPGGADVFQLNGVKNLHFSMIGLTASLSGAAGAGSNAISITGGFDNITILDVWCDNLPSLDKTDHIDGGKALTVQCDTATLEVGSLKARIYAKGCSQGFGLEAGLFNFLGKKVAIDVDLIAEGCYAAVTCGGIASTGVLPSGTQIGVKVKALAINCQVDLTLGRMHGGDFDVRVVTTQTAAARKLSPTGIAWYAADTLVQALKCTYAKNAFIKVTGNKGDCDYKAQIGGASPGSSGLTGSTEHCDMLLDIAGTSALADVFALDSGGNTMANSRLYCTITTASSLPSAFYAPALRNDLQPGAFNTGTFTGSLTGCTTVPTAAIKYSIIEDIVTLEIPLIQGTSNTTAASITGMPSFLFPLAAQSAIGISVNNGTGALSRLIVQTTGDISIYNGLSGAFTAAGPKGTDFSTISYHRS